MIAALWFAGAYPRLRIKRLYPAPDVPSMVAWQRWCTMGDRPGQFLRRGIAHWRRCSRDFTLFETYTRRMVAPLAGVGKRRRMRTMRLIRLLLGTGTRLRDDWVRAEAEFCVLDPAFNALWAWLGAGACRSCAAARHDDSRASC